MTYIKEGGGKGEGGEATRSEGHLISFATTHAVPWDMNWTWNPAAGLLNFYRARVAVRKVPHWGKYFCVLRLDFDVDNDLLEFPVVGQEEQKERDPHDPLAERADQVSGVALRRAAVIVNKLICRYVVGKGWFTRTTQEQA